MKEDGVVEVRSPMAGTVVVVKAAAGDDVVEGDELLVLESMKMEIPVAAPSAGRLTGIHVAPAEQIDEDQLLAVID
jgi:biotin carboxyl carrier protein